MINTLLVNRIGETIYNNHGSKMKIIEYFSNRNITVEFDNGYIFKNTTYSNFKKGDIKSTKCLSVFCVGYLDLKNFKSNEKSYKVWNSMLRRCYSEQCLIRNPAYKSAVVCEEWFSYAVFKIWFDKEYYKSDKYKLNLDKDVLKKDNKIYSPDTCVFVPSFINGLFVKSKKSRGKYLIGVSFDKNGNKFVAKCCTNKAGRVQYIGRFNTEIEAFYAYKAYKENIIKQIAEEHKNNIPEKLYVAMMEYKVELTD